MGKILKFLKFVYFNYWSKKLNNLENCIKKHSNGDAKGAKILTTIIDIGIFVVLSIVLIVILYKTNYNKIILFIMLWLMTLFIKTAEMRISIKYLIENFLMYWGLFSLTDDLSQKLSSGFWGLVSYIIVLVLIIIGACCFYSDTSTKKSGKK